MSASEARSEIGMASQLEHDVAGPPAPETDGPPSPDVAGPPAPETDDPPSPDVAGPPATDVAGPPAPDVDRPLEDDVDEVLLSHEEIQGRLAELAAEVDRDYADDDDLMLVGVLKGGFMVMADLVRYLGLPVTMDFMACSSYGSSTRSSGVVRILKDLDTPIEGRHVLVVEDVVDSGLTLDYLMKNLRSRNPASLEVLALLTKPNRQRSTVPIRYEGFRIPEVFVVGYGLDYAERYRNLPYIATLVDEAYQ